MSFTASTLKEAHDEVAEHLTWTFIKKVLRPEGIRLSAEKEQKWADKMMDLIIEEILTP